MKSAMGWGKARLNLKSCCFPPAGPGHRPCGLIGGEEVLEREEESALWVVEKELSGIYSRTAVRDSPLVSANTTRFFLGLALLLRTQLLVSDRSGEEEEDEDEECGAAV